MSTDGVATHKDMSRIPVAYLILGWENNRNAIIDFFRNGTTINIVTDESAPPVTSTLDWLKKELRAARKRGAKLKLITNITKLNLPDCKRRMNEVDELRHLDGIEVVFGVSDLKFMAMVPSLAPREEFEKVQFIESDSESVVGIKERIFDALWDRAIPAKSRFAELEGGVDKRSARSTMKGKTVIDRIHACMECKQTFIYSFEAEEHRKGTGHKNFREYPII